MSSRDGARTGGHIVLGNARQHNLKNVSLRIPKGKLTVFAGLSGSGKSSIVFGTIAVESQRQLNESFPAFIRNRLPRHERPDAEVMENLSTAIVVDQKPVGGNSRSTVGTMTDIYSVLRVLFSRHGEPTVGPSTSFSFNDPNGMCPECEGLGRTVRLDLSKLIDESKSLNQGAIRHPAFARGSFQWQLYAESGLFDPELPIGRFSAADRETLLHGSGFTVDRAGRNGVYKNAYEGVVLRFTRRYLKKGLDSLNDRERTAVGEVVSEGPCQLCHGGRLNQKALASRIRGYSIADLAGLEVDELIDVLVGLDGPTVKPIVAAALSGLRRVSDIGLGYLSLNRETPTLSGGESQRLKTVRHLGSSLTDLTFIFDEPSIGLHPRDVHRLNALLLALRDKGNTVLVVEHDRDVLRIADHVVEMGPGAGAEGGEVVFEGTVDQLREAGTATGRALHSVPGLKDTVRTPTGRLSVRDAQVHNLRDVSVDIPTGVLTTVTGVAGSGKSTLVSTVLPQQHPGVVHIDQSATGISLRSVPATYLDVMDPIRAMFAASTDQDAGLFSFNSTGACRNCKGRGIIQTDLAYLDPVTTTCEECGGKRYRQEALAHTVGGRTIADVLSMTTDDAIRYFTDQDVARRLALLSEVGLGYLTLGQPLSTLSGGERQRLKLANRLGETGTVYVLDEPTTGLHMADVGRLLALMDRLVDSGNTVIAIEHDLDVVRHSDWVIDMGPEAGRHGGQVIFTGTPHDLLDEAHSHTARALAADLEEYSARRRDG